MFRLLIVLVSASFGLSCGCVIGLFVLTCGWGVCLCNFAFDLL